MKLYIGAVYHTFGYKIANNELDNNKNFQDQSKTWLSHLYIRFLSHTHLSHFFDNELAIIIYSAIEFPLFFGLTWNYLARMWIIKLRVGPPFFVWKALLT